MQTTAIRFSQTGGAEVLSPQTVPVAAPGAGEALVRHAFAGVNFIDVYHRGGLYPVALPSGIGLEAAGVVEEVGAGVTDFAPGARVGYCAAGLGAYSERRIVQADRLIPLPDDVSFEAAAAILLKGITAEYLIRRLYPVQKGQFVLFYAVAGGVGQIALQWLKQIGAVVIGAVGDGEKEKIARSLGCDYVVRYRDRGEDVAATTREITGGRGVAVAYDSIGKATFEATLDSLAPRGMFVSFGNASGAVAPFAPGLLAQKGSLFFTRPTLMTYCAESAEMRAAAAALFAAKRAGLKIKIDNVFALRAAADAHRRLESGQSAGAIVLRTDSD